VETGNRSILSYFRAGAVDTGNRPIWSYIVAGIVLLATLAIGGWLIWSQLISANRPRAIYLPKEYRPSGPAPAPYYGARGRVGTGGRARGFTITPAVPPSPPTPADIAAFFNVVRQNNVANAQALLGTNRLLAQAVSADKVLPLDIAPSKEMAQVLLEAGANVNATDGVHNDPPIRWHARDRGLDVSSVLFSHGATLPSDIFFITASAIFDQTALAMAIQANPALLNSRSRANDVLGGQATPLLVAATWDRTDAVAVLLNAGAKVDDIFEGKSGATALHLAAWNDDPAMINLLLAHGAQIEAMSKSPVGTPLYWAVMRGGRNAVPALLARGATVTNDMVDLAAKGAKGTNPSKDPNLPGLPTDYAAIGVMLRDHMSAAPTTALAPTTSPAAAATTAPATQP